MEIASTNKVDVIVTGLIKKIGNTYTIDLKAIDPVRQRYLVTALEMTDNKDDIPAALRKAASKIRDRLESESDRLRQGFWRHRFDAYHKKHATAWQARQLFINLAASYKIASIEAYRDKVLLRQNSTGCR